MSGRGAGLIVLAASVAYLAGSLAFPWGSAARPGPGFFPVAVGVFLCVLALCLVLVPRAAGGAARAPRVALPAGARRRVAATTAALAGFTLLMPWIGFPVVAFLFVAVLLKRLGGGPWPGVLIAALLSAGLSYYLFAVLLAVPLPRGIFVD